MPGAIGLQKGFRSCAAAEEGGETPGRSASWWSAIRPTSRGCTRGDPRHGPPRTAEADARLAAEATGAVLRSSLPYLRDLGRDASSACGSTPSRRLRPRCLCRASSLRGQGTVLPLELADTLAALNEALLDLLRAASLAVGLHGRRRASQETSWQTAEHRRRLCRPHLRGRPSIMGLRRSRWRALDAHFGLGPFVGMAPDPESLDAARLTRAGHGWSFSPISRSTRPAEAAVVEKIHDRLREQVAARGGRVDEFACLHHPEDGCDCRKPASGLSSSAIRNRRFGHVRAFRGDQDGRDGCAACGRAPHPRGGLGRSSAGCWPGASRALATSVCSSRRSWASLPRGRCLEELGGGTGR